MASSSAQTFFYIVTEYRNVAKHFAWNVGDEKKKPKNLMQKTCKKMLSIYL